ncbi:hypothetical protein KLPMCK381M_24455 [Klebsiella pneumoniae]
MSLHMPFKECNNITFACVMLQFKPICNCFDPDPKSCAIQKQNAGMIYTP